MSHRRTAVKQKRVRQVKRQITLICSAIVVMAAAFLFISRENPKDENKTAAVEVNANPETVREDELQKTVKEEEIIEEVTQDIPQEEETADERFARVKKEAVAAEYPEKVIELLDKNPETIEFVEAYGEKKDTVSPEKIEEFKEGEIPKLIQWDERWGYAPYGTGIIAVCGCGPTCMSMVLSALTGDDTLTPVKLAQYGTENGYVTDENDTTWAYMREACEEWGVKCREDVLEQDETLKELEKGHPIVCSVGPGDFTQKGHFILLASHKDGNIEVHDPFSKVNSSKTWTYKQLKDQIKVMWIYSKK